MGGKEAIVRLRALDPKVKAIVSSGYANDLVLRMANEVERAAMRKEEAPFKEMLAELRKNLEVFFVE
ncbi:MAG: hypothetical protein E4H46_00155 [Desulfobacterales bacterium]|nr:MAG: hypothetical protein E4H46_00155 [Desulfobacterales bacterium]